jgi:hypothetical protein
MRVRTKIYNKVIGGSRRRKLRSFFLCLLLLSLILTISLWIIVEIMNENHILPGPPWEGIRRGEIPHLLALFVLSFSSSVLYIMYYIGITETSKTAPLYLLAILVIVVLARLLFRF